MDEDSNRFLQELASRTGGRFHVYSSADFDRGENDPFAALQACTDKSEIQEVNPPKTVAPPPTAATAE